MPSPSASPNGPPGAHPHNGALPPKPPARSGLARNALQVLLTALARLRFVAILAAIGVVIVKWDWLAAHYDKWTRPADAAAAADPGTEYFCPMHPTVVRDNNKEKCPICFMPLAKRKKGEVTDAPLPPGVVSRVQLSPYRVLLAGVHTTEVAHRPLAKEVTTVGTVEFDERGLKHVAARVKGRIDRLFANQTGQVVRKGDPLAEVYSPDLVVTVQNLLDARSGGNPGLERSARDRLRLWGIEGDQIDQLVKGGKPITHLTIRSPIDGHVIKRYQTEGRYVDEGEPLYDVADLGTVWVQAQVYEDDLGFLPADNHALREADRLPVSATTPAYLGESFDGALTFVYPHVDRESRTLTVRFELKNPGHRLKPGMTATVKLRVGPDRLAQAGGAGARLRRQGDGVLAVPEGSVIDTGGQKVVYREAGPGEFEGVLVELGPRMAGPDGVRFYPVLAGLEPGERVVTSGSFLIDAETRLNPAAGSIYIGGSGGSDAGSGVTVRPTTPHDPVARVAAGLAQLGPEDRRLAEAQGFCPVLEGSRLGSMGKPVKLVLDGKPVFLCCSGCEEKAKRDPVRTAARAEELRRGGGKPAAPAAPAGPKGPEPKSPDPEEAEIRAELAKLPPADRALAEKQRYCPVRGERLGSMGVPPKVMIRGRAVFLCCKGCDKDALKDPDKTLRKVDELVSKSGEPGK
jgi:Cu(I)/Ag(I) efflux system membrane fusion protein